MSKALTRDKKCAQERGDAIRRWMVGRASAGMQMPTPIEVQIFKTGFNMAWKLAYKATRNHYKEKALEAVRAI